MTEIKEAIEDLQFMIGHDTALSEQVKKTALAALKTVEWLLDRPCPVGSLSYEIQVKFKEIKENL